MFLEIQNVGLNLSKSVKIISSNKFSLTFVKFFYLTWPNCLVKLSIKSATRQLKCQILILMLLILYRVKHKWVFVVGH